MNIFSRIKTLFGGFVSATTDKIEAKNPQLLISEAEKKIQKSRKDAQKQLVEIQTWAETVRLEMKEAEVRLTDVRVKIDLATQARDKKLLTELIVLEEELENELEEKKRLREVAVNEAVRVRDDYKRFESEMNSRMKELETIKTQSEIVKMREKISAADYRYGISYENNINSIRRSLNQRCAKIAAMEQLSSENTEMNIKRIADNAAFKRAEMKAAAILNLPIKAEIVKYQ